jgi:hypothetical protein
VKTAQESFDDEAGAQIEAGHLGDNVGPKILSGTGHMRKRRKPKRPNAETGDPQVTAPLRVGTLYT